MMKQTRIEEEKEPKESEERVVKQERIEEEKTGDSNWQVIWTLNWNLRVSLNWSQNGVRASLK